MTKLQGARAILTFKRVCLGLFSCLIILGCGFSNAQSVIVQPESAQNQTARSSLAKQRPNDDEPIAVGPKIIKDSFSDQYDLIYQIQVTSPKAGSKSSFGSGFQVTSDGLIVTNYHVVSGYVQDPDIHQIRYRSHTGETGELALVNFDVVNDLAVLRHPHPRTKYFNFGESAIAKGARIYALGNPHDYGVTLVQGRNNGLVEHSFDERILFSGSLNSGMSGGPTLNEVGDVVGVNVATAGSQLSFLVPVSKAVALVNSGLELATDGYQLELAKQVKRYQRRRLQDLIDREWESESFVGQNLFGEIRRDFQCWGQTNEKDKDRDVERIYKTCDAADTIYLSRDHDAGHIHFSFSQKKAIELNTLQFSRTLVPAMSANNYSSFDYSTEFQCNSDFLKHDTDKSQYIRATVCIRAYKKMLGLFDSLVFVERNAELDASAYHFSVSAAEQDQLELLHEKFISRVLDGGGAQ